MVPSNESVLSVPITAPLERSGTDSLVPSKGSGSSSGVHTENFFSRMYHKMVKDLSPSQIRILLLFALVEFFTAMVISIQGLLYPQVARAKGATPSEYGLALGSFELTIFVFAPIMGAKMGILKPQRLFNHGILTISLCCIMLGFLHHIQGHYLFMLSSVIVRVIEAIGDAAFVTASFSIIAAEFPNSVPTTFAIMETFYGLGMIAGPIIGSALYQFDGFTLPLAVMGLLLLSSALVTYLLVTREFNREDLQGKIASSGSLDMFQMLRVPSIALTAFSTFATDAGIGFMTNNLQKHLEQFGLPEFELGCIFMLNGGVYAISAPLWGRLCERSSQPKMYSLIGSLLIVVGFALIGPIPFFESWEPSILAISVGQIAFGLGIGSSLVSAVLLLLQDAMDNGHPDDVNTHGLVSGLWTSMTSLGFFVGTTIGGLLDHYVGFRWGTLFIFGLQFILVGLYTRFFFYSVPNLNTSSTPKPNQSENLKSIVITCDVNVKIPEGVRNQDGYRKTETEPEPLSEQQHPFTTKKCSAAKQLSNETRGL